MLVLDSDVSSLMLALESAKGLHLLASCAVLGLVIENAVHHLLGYLIQRLGPIVAYRDPVLARIRPCVHPVVLSPIQTPLHADPCGFLPSQT